MRIRLALIALLLAFAPPALAQPANTFARVITCGTAGYTNAAGALTIDANGQLCISGGGGGGGAATIADGADVAEGAIADAAATAGGTGTLSAKLRLLTTQFNTLNTSVATAANQATANTSLASIATNTTGAATSAKQDTGNTSLASIATNTTGAATAANQTSQITQETAINTLLGLQADAACATDNGTCTLAALVKRLNQRTTTSIAAIGTPMQTTGGTVGLVAGVAEIGNVKNSGTFAVQSTLSAETTKVIGTVNQGTSPWVISGALTANQSVNVAQINGVTPLMGNGTTGTGSQRVTVASDNTPFPVKVDQTTPGTTNAVSLAQIGATTAATGNGVVGTGVQRVAIASDNTAFSVNATPIAPSANTYVGNVNTQSTKVTYRAATGAPAIDGAGVLLQIQGSGTKTIRVTRLIAGGNLTVTSNGLILVQKYTTAVSGGTSAAVTAVPLDSASAAATAAVLRWTAVGTAGSAVGAVGARKSTWTADTLANSAEAIFSFGDVNGQALVLRGTAEYLAVSTSNFGSYAGATYTVEIEWTEE